MTLDAYRKFLESAGHPVIRESDHLWYKLNRGVWIAFPLHRAIVPSRDEMRRLFRRGMLFRFIGDDTRAPHSYYLGCDRKPYDLAGLNSKARNQTRRGLEHWRLEEKSCAWLAEHGLELNRQTVRRQRRRASDYGDERWYRECLAAESVPGFSAWAVEGKAGCGAVALTYTMEGVVYILLQRSSPMELRTYPNNALTYLMTKHFLSRDDIHLVFYGLRPLAASSSLDHFKEGMGYRRFPVQECFVIHPWLRAALPFLGRAVNALSLVAHDEKITKASKVLHILNESWRAADL